VNAELHAVAVEAGIAGARAYDEMHPRPRQVTQKQTAEMLGLSQPTVSRMVKAGIIKLNRFGMIPISEIDRALQVAA